MKPNWANMGGGHGDNPKRGYWAERLYRDDALGVQWEVFTTHTNDWTERSRKEKFFKDGVKKHFKTEAELLKALNQPPAAKGEE